MHHAKGKTLDTDFRAETDTPLMAQYRAIKAEYPDAILFFRMGDFFEMFGEDAKVGARVLGITLTSRGHGKAGEVPLAGFPHHALDGYLAKMLRAGYRVAICEQVEDPKLAKGIVKREVVQVVTPGTITADNLLESRRNNFLSSVVCENDRCGLASVDVSTGEFRVTECPFSSLPEMIQAVGPAELIVPQRLADTLASHLSSRNGNLPILTRREDWFFDRETGYKRLIRHFKTTSLKGFGIEDMGPGIAAAGAVLEYLQETQKTELHHIGRLIPYSDDAFMVLDSATRRNLEISVSMAGTGREGTLLSILDRTVTPMGGRTLTAWLQRPLNRIAPIKERLEAVQALFKDREGSDRLVGILKSVGDLERLIAKVATRRATPRDVAALRRGLALIPQVIEALTPFSSGRLAVIRETLDPCPGAVSRIASALTDDPPASLTEGGIIREGYNPELDRLRSLATSGKDWILKLQTAERERTGIPSLKIGYNRVFGYYIEVTRPHLDKIPPEYIRKQTLVNAERFITPDLKAREEEILHAEERIASLEYELFESLRDFLIDFVDPIQKDGQLIGELDAFLSLSRVASENKYVMPEIHEGDEIVIRDGRHPVVERFLPSGETFIPNDVVLDGQENRILLITGPNMAGKSTYIRQVGLIVLMAQIGSFVPASSARIGLVDRIFTRVGAQDNLIGGESTFLVEMNETANILNNATPKSLVLLDEIGRGTSTFDGLSIAWAVAEYLHDAVGAKTLFATHYHELTELARILPGVKNFNVAVKEWKDHVVFLRKIVPGGCEHSYGIQVARLAGLPDAVIARAREILHNLEANELTPNGLPKIALGDHAPRIREANQLSLFEEEEQRLRDALDRIDIDRMTPLEALKTLSEWKNRFSPENFRKEKGKKRDDLSDP